MAKAKMTAPEMYEELVSLGYVRPATVEPSILMEPTAYISVPTTLAFATPPIPAAPEREGKNAKLGAGPKGNTKRKKRPSARK